MHRWVGKVAVVTGASAGIGAAIVVDLVKAGMTVVGLARRKERVELLRSRIPSGATGRLHAFRCDVADDASVAEAFEWIPSQFGPMHVLVNNAGIYKLGSLLTDGNEEVLRSVLQTNLWGLVLCTKKAMASMKRDKVIGGHIINVNSVVGHQVHYRNQTARPVFNVYPVSKFGVTALNEVLRQEFNYDKLQFKVTVCAYFFNIIIILILHIFVQNISPGMVKTELVGDDLDYETIAHLQPEDVSQAVLYALGTPSKVNVSEIIIKPIEELF